MARWARSDALGDVARAMSDVGRGQTKGKEQSRLDLLLAHGSRPPCSSARDLGRTLARCGRVLSCNAGALPRSLVIGPRSGRDRQAGSCSLAARRQQARSQFRARQGRPAGDGLRPGGIRPALAARGRDGQRRTVRRRSNWDLDRGRALIIQTDLTSAGRRVSPRGREPGIGMPSVFSYLIDLYRRPITDARLL